MTTRDARLILAGDIGGTKTLLGLFDDAGETIQTTSYESAAFDSFEAILHKFLAASPRTPTSVTLAVAGPVIDQRSRLTNLPWTIDAEVLRQAADLMSVALLNDIEALAWAVPFLDVESLHTLREGSPHPGGVRAIIAPGTGLGEAFVSIRDGRLDVFPSEGGHADFAPIDETQVALLRFLFEEMERVSYERVASGSGLPNVYRFFRDAEGLAEDQRVAERIAEAKDITPLIVDAAIHEKSNLCMRTLDLFIRILGAEAGNLALKTMATGGVYLGGGIPPRILQLLQLPTFIDAFDAKGRFTSMMQDIPIHIIQHPAAALLGAAKHAASRDTDEVV